MNRNLVSFEEAYNTYYPVLCNYAGSIVKEQTEAEDIASNVFLKLMEEWDTILVETSLKAYLFKSTYNQCMDVLKHKAVHNKYLNYVKHLDFLVEEGFDYPLSGLIGCELNEILKKAIAKLPKQCRTIFNMSRNDEMTYEEIASKLGISINTVRTQIKIALVKLRFELKEYLPLFLFLIMSETI
jgi:RNA polymerase sigma-70 factor (ECF subfamily)